MEIIGVDFSGARSDHNTWLAQGFLGKSGLVLRGCRPMSRAELTDILLDLPGSAVAALDFPFSVPLDFARYWQPQAESMPQLWAAAAAMESEEFMAMRDDFVARNGEPKRRCDINFPECYSPLHQGNPNLVPMTFQGMRMLDRLWPEGCDVPPLEPPTGASTTLLEAMPGATLRALGLPFKGYKNGTKAMQLRQEILDWLGRRSPVPVPNLAEVREQCLSSHDCLDSLVAAVTAALWARNPSAFRLPLRGSHEELDPAVLIEGWLYAPIFL